MNKITKLFFFLIFLLLTNCSFDDKSGIWSGDKDEKRRISEIEKKQKKIIEIDKIYISDNEYNNETILKKNITLSKPKKNNFWKMSGLNHQNSLGNIYLSSAEHIFLKKKIGKNKFSKLKKITTLLAYDDNLIFSDDTGTVFNFDNNGKIIWKKNIYKKNYKKVYKSLSLSIYKNNIYVADNIGFVYAISLLDGELVWIKNHRLPLKSKIKIFENKIFLIDQDNKIFCLSAKDGSRVWDIIAISSFIKSQNLLSSAVTKDGILFAINSAADLFKIDAKTGNISWSKNTSVSTYADATDFFTSSDIVISGDSVILSAAGSTFSMNINNGSINWETKVSTISTPIIDKKNIFLITNNGFFVILNKETGEILSSTYILKLLKKKKRKTSITGFVMGSGKLYAFTKNGYLIISSASSGKIESFKKISSKILSDPIINNGKLYIVAENSKIIGLN